TTGVAGVSAAPAGAASTLIDLTNKPSGELAKPARTDASSGLKQRKVNSYGEITANAFVVDLSARYSDCGPVASSVETRSRRILSSELIFAWQSTSQMALISPS